MFYIAKFLVFMAMKIAFSMKLVGKENIPKNTTVIFASNHRTNADPPLISCGLKGKHSFMAKEELFRNKFFGWLIKNLGAFPVSRGKGDSAVLDKAVENLENGRNLMIFPEGTRSKDGKVHRGHSGAAVIAARSGKPIVPVGIVFGEKLKFRTKITINYGEPIYPEDYVEVCDTPNPRQLVKLKNRYMADIKALVEGPPQLEEISEESEKESGNE
ncbi:MAG: 1-acyl-sn-glycerol-3-phosphate acyltransferase [Ruminococcus sp.]|nr:1-acyl-sn-glycerol-3-phosphate acyltransferase [Ruminococcus sp.]